MLVPSKLPAATGGGAMTNKEMAKVARAASEQLRRYYTSGLDVSASSKTTRELEAMAAALESEALAVVEGWIEVPSDLNWIPQSLYTLTSGRAWKPQIPVTVTITRKPYDEVA